MSDTPTASPITLDRWEKSSNLAALAALASSGQVTIRPNELIRTTDSNRVYHWTGTALDIVSAPVHHGTVANPAALDGIYRLPSCTRGVHPGDTAYVTAAGCEYRVTSGVNATATWAACADPAGTAATAVSTHNTATDSHTDLRELIAGKQAALTISDVGTALLNLSTPTAAKIPRINSDGAVELINVPSGGSGSGGWIVASGPSTTNLVFSSNGDNGGVFYLAGRIFGGGTFANPSGPGGPIKMLRSSSSGGTALDLTDRAENQSHSSDVAGSWICCDLGSYALAPTDYSLRASMTYNVDYPRNWKLQGTNSISSWSISDVAAATWTDLDIRANDATLAELSAWGHFVCSEPVGSSYRYLRMVLTGVNSSNRYFLSCAEWEFYGTLATPVSQSLPGATGWLKSTSVDLWMPYYGDSLDLGVVFSAGCTRTDLPWVTDPGAALLTAASASAQRTALGMTAWAVAPWTDGTTSDIPEGTQLYFTNARADARADARIAAQKGQAEGIMPLDSGGKAPLAYIPDALIGQVKFKGVWDAATNSPALPSATASMGYYYVTSVAGSYGGIDYGVGDWCISDGSTWGKVDNTDAVVSFNGRIGAILPIASDYASHYLGLHAQADDAARLGGQLPSHYETAIGNPSANGYLLSSTTAGVRSWVAPYSHPATHAQSVIDSSTGWITTALAGKQPAGNYAGSATPGGVATEALTCTGNSATASYATYPRFSGDAVVPAASDITQRTGSGIYEGYQENVTRAKGWPVDAQYTHLIAATHSNGANYHSLQIAGLFIAQRFFARNTGGDGATPWVELLHNGNVGSATPDGALSVAKTSGLQEALNLRAVGYPLTWFGGDGSESSPNTWTTAQFIAFLVNCGAFNQPQWSSRGAWNYVGNRVITDTGVGHIHLAGATVEVFKGTLSEYMVRVTTGPTTSVSGAVPKAVFVYENHGAGFAPGWFRLMSAEQYPNLQAIENLAGTAGVPVKTAANTWELKNGATAAVVIGGTTLNFQNGVLVSVSP